MLKEDTTEQDDLAMEESGMKPPEFFSRYRIGQLVYFAPTKGIKIDAYIRTVTFTANKVRYSIRLTQAGSTLHNIDSILLRDADRFEVIEMPMDNYS